MENVEKRMELINMMRMEQQENAGRMRNRNQILNSNEPIKKKTGYSFYIKMAVCMILFLLFVYMETENISCFGITHEQIQKTVSRTIDVNLFAFMEQFPYTLEE